MADVILRTEGLGRRFDRLVAVDDVSLSIEAGEVFGLLGTNGAGKTTLIKMLITLLPTSAGTACIGGFDIVRQAAQVRRIIGYVPQLQSVDGTLTGYENLAVFARLYGLPKAERKPRIEQALAFMGLSDAANRLARQYSGGMLRRLEIAQAMLHHPRLLVLDEPTLGLDPLAREAVWQHIEALRSQYGTTILLTTHYMDEAESLCTRVAIMRNGRLVALGSPEELKAALGGVTMDEVFTHFTGGASGDGGAASDTATASRATGRRV
jgi:ABC-2 type transport system ATP-binding protein